ncbi:MAG TPA: RagB/SusD family nutrient uptake outer membrane protein [Gemmatimonadaceae bacterium]|nr:RagB/SusD family nutrient uptake outer membrane protein [Gemmatimonadaceae bacterium]
MRLFHARTRARRVAAALSSTLVGAWLAGVTLAAGCTSLDVTNPNQPSSQSFWKTPADADRGLVATYNALLLLGTFGRWQAFANDIRSDIGTARTSPWGDLANFNAFQLSDYNFEINRHLWIHNYELIARANLVIANVPSIEMDATQRARIVGEAKVLRALGYYNLVTLFENVPLVTAPLGPEERPAAAAPTQTWTQIEQDLAEAAAALPEAAPAGEAGRATRGTALALLGRARLQQRKWAEAATPLGQVISGGRYALLANYADNFRQETDLVSTEAIFEVATEDMWPIGVTGLSFPKMIGPCYRPGAPLPEYNPTFCDGRPTRWYFQEFSKSRTASGAVDPRLDVTLLYDRADRATEMVYDRPRASYFVDNPASPAREDTMIFFRKYGETNIRTDQRWDNPINYRVIRYADVLLMQAEALNEQGQTAQAYQWVNQVRRRVGKSDLAGLTQAQLRDSILAERMFELGLESSRFNDLRRHNLLSPQLASRDADFATFIVGKSERLPIPTTERNLNPNMPQNPSW